MLFQFPKRSNHTHADIQINTGIMNVMVVVFTVKVLLL